MQIAIHHRRRRFKINFFTISPKHILTLSNLLFNFSPLNALCLKKIKISMDPPPPSLLIPPPVPPSIPPPPSTTETPTTTETPHLAPPPNPTPTITHPSYAEVNKKKTCFFFLVSYKVLILICFSCFAR